MVALIFVVVLLAVGLVVLNSAVTGPVDRFSPPFETISSVTVVGSGVVSGIVSVTGSGVVSVTGSVGSVTGSVGSVTGSVGSVTGSVGSVTASVVVSRLSLELK